MTTKIAYLICALFFFASLVAEEAASLKEITIDLQDPVYKDGTLSTDHGGVLTSPEPPLRVQAKKISYTRKTENEKPIFFVTAEDELMIEYGQHILIGKRLEYDFIAKTGVLYDGRTKVGPWFVGGKVIYLKPDGTFTIKEAFLTTCENTESEWKIHASQASIVKNSLVAAKNVRIFFFHIPIFWMPIFKSDLKTLSDTPIRYEADWRGSQGTRFTMRYRIFSNDDWRVFTRLDYTLKRGLGGGVDTDYRSHDKKSEFLTRNYVARDNSIENARTRTRSRFEGSYVTRFSHDKTSIDLKYDKLSDKEMEADYYINDFNLHTAKQTRLKARHQENLWIANFVARKRINSFQTVKEELPTIGGSWRPLQLGETGIVSNNRLTAGYLEYRFANGTPGVSNFHSSRLSAQHSIYRPIPIGVITVTPQVGVTGIYYGESPQGPARAQGVFGAGIEANSRFHRSFFQAQHIFEPYINHEYLSAPFVPSAKHYIFDIQDGYARLNVTRFGVRNSIYVPSILTTRPFIFVDLYANAFIDTRTMERKIPRAYTKVVVNPRADLSCSLHSAWNYERNAIDYSNLRVDYTWSRDLALGVEYRHRSAFSWRKADPTNFILDSFTKENVLLASPLSDRRDTFLTHVYYKITPNWACDLQTRQGWRRKEEPSYFESKIQLSTWVRCNWRLRFAYERLTSENRFSVSFSLEGRGGGK